MKPDPLDLPVQRLEFVCTATRPVSFWPWDRTADPFEVRLARALGGEPPGPVYFRVLDDFDICPHEEFELEAVLWGRRAVAGAEEIRAAIRRLGSELHDPAPFAAKERLLRPSRTLRELAEDLPRHARRITLTLETPLDIDMPGEPPFVLAELVEESARRLAILDLDDRPERPDVDPARYADETVRRALAATRTLETGFSGWEGADVDEGVSDRITWLGHCEYAYPEPECWPWLLALSLGRAGRRRHEGFGAMSLWVQSGP